MGGRFIPFQDKNSVDGCNKGKAEDNKDNEYVYFLGIFEVFVFDFAGADGQEKNDKSENVNVTGNQATYDEVALCPQCSVYLYNTCWSSGY